MSVGKSAYVSLPEGSSASVCMSLYLFKNVCVCLCVHDHMHISERPCECAHTDVYERVPL